MIASGTNPPFTAWADNTILDAPNNVSHRHLEDSQELEPDFEADIEAGVNKKPVVNTYIPPHKRYVSETQE